MLVALPHRRLKRAQHRRRLPLQRHADVHRHALAQQPVVDQRAVAANGSRRLQRQNAPRRRRSRQPHRLAHLVVRRPAVALQVAQNRRVQLVQSGRRFLLTSMLSRLILALELI